MIPARLDFPCRTNADYVEEFPVAVGDVPVDLTGYSVTLVARLNVNGAALFTLGTVSSGQGIRIVEAANGILSIRISRQTLQIAYNAAVSAGQIGDSISLVYDMKFTLPNGDQEVWCDGVIQIEKGVTA